jgi:hypothetical protein
MPNQPKTPNRVIRVDDELWSDYGAACEAEGIARSDDLRTHMQRRVRAWKRRPGDGTRTEPSGGEPAGMTPDGPGRK